MPGRWRGGRGRGRRTCWSGAVEGRSPVRQMIRNGSIIFLDVRWIKSDGPYTIRVNSRALGRLFIWHSQRRNDLTRPSVQTRKRKKIQQWQLTGVRLYVCLASGAFVAVCFAPPAISIATGQHRLPGNFHSELSYILYDALLISSGPCWLHP